MFTSNRAVIFGQESAKPIVMLSETKEPFDKAINIGNTNSDLSPPKWIVAKADCCPKTENSDLEKSPVRLPNSWRRARSFNLGK